MFLGMDILSDEQSLSNSKLVSNLSSFSIKNGIFDELYVSSDPNKFKKKEYDWAADTLILATFDSQTLEGGNIGALGSKIQSMQLRRREVGDVTWTTLAAYQVPDTDKSTSEADKATTSAANAAISEKNALNSETAAAAKASEANELVENLKTLKGTLPSDFTEYTQQIADAKKEFDNKIDKHNTSDTAHQDIRDDLEKISSNVYSKTEADAKFGTPATADQLGPVKVGTGLGVTNDGTLSVTSVNGFTVKAQTTDPGVGSVLDTGTVLLVYA